MDHQYMYKSQALRPSTSLGQKVIYLLSTAATTSIIMISVIYAPVICIHCPPPPPPPRTHVRGWAGIMIFTFQSPGISPALWGQADGNNPVLCPTLHNRKSQQGKCPNVITPTLPRHCGDNQKVIVPHLTPAIPRLSPLVGAVDTNDWCIILFKCCIYK